eukprot:gene16589-16405_t
MVALYGGFATPSETAGLGALLGPLYGVIMVDYWLIRKGRIDVPQLYSEDPNGAYYYSHGVNLRAVAAFVPAAVIAIVLALLPGFASVSPFSWLFGAGIAGVLYLLIAKRQPFYADISGESIAVDNVTIAQQARSVAAAGTEIVGLTPFFGAESVEGNFESYLAAIAVMDRVMAYDQPFDAVIQAGYGEHGREGLQELLDVPVVDITDAAASTAMFLGHAYSVVTTLDRTVPLIEDRLKLSGLYERCASVRASGMAVLELEEHPLRAMEAIVRQAELAISADKAEVICLGCGGMAWLDEQIRQRTGR